MIDFGISSALLHVPNASILEQCMKNTIFEYTRFSPSFDCNEMEAEEIGVLVDVAHQYGSLVIADKLESSECLATTIAAGIDYASGYIIQPPQEEIENSENMEI